MSDKWDKRFMGMAKHISEWSKDNSTGVGAVIVDDDKKVLSLGFNGPPRGVDDNVPERQVSPEKHFYNAHAERNALDEAETSLRGGTIYCTFFTCSGCAQGIIQKQLKRVVAPEPDWDHPRFGPSQRAAQEMFKEAGIEVAFYNQVDESLIAFWEIGCGGGKVHHIITEEKFYSYIDHHKNKLADRGFKVSRYNINEKLKVIEFFVGKKEKQYLYYGNFETNDFIYKRDNQ